MNTFIYNKYKKLFEDNQKLLKIVDTQLAFISGKNPKNEFQMAVILLWSKATVTMQAIQVLCKNGFGEDALSLVRCLFEILISIRYLEKKPKLRSKRFFQFYALQEKEYMDRYTQAGIGKVSKSSRDEINKEYMKIKQARNSKDKNWTDFITSNKRNHNIKNVAEEVNLSWDYDFVYYSLSHLFTHSTPRGASKYMLNASSTNSIIPILRPGDRQIKEALALSQRYFSGVLKDFNRIWKTKTNIKSEFSC